MTELISSSDDSEAEAIKGAVPITAFVPTLTNNDKVDRKARFPKRIPEKPNDSGNRKAPQSQNHEASTILTLRRVSETTSKPFAWNRRDTMRSDLRRKGNIKKAWRRQKQS